MPIYEYRCETCASLFERLVRGSKDKVACPSCGARKVKRLPSTFGIAGGSKPSTGGASCVGCSGRSCSTCH